MNNLNNLSDEQINGMIDYLQNILMERGWLKQEPPQNSNYSHNLEETNAQRTQATQENSESKKALLKAKSGQINYVKTRIIQGLKEKNSPFWDKPEIVANKERGHNALNGEAYCNLNDMILDMEKNRLGFQSNAWVSLEEAKMLGASKEERDAIFKATQNKEISPVRLMFIKNKEPVPLVDNNGELVIDKNTKKPKHKQFAVIENGQKVFKPAYRDIEPQAQFKFVYNYNIEMFPSINKEKIKPLNLDKLSNYAYKTRLFHQKDYSQEKRDKTNIIYEDLHRDLSPDNRNEALLERMRSYTLLKNEKYNQLANKTNQQTQTRSQSQSYYQKKNKASSGVER
ncbi:ArdC-like ssDNA-binding domain-containing protein [Helicobacter pylori]